MSERACKRVRVWWEEVKRWVERQEKGKRLPLYGTWYKKNEQRERERENWEGSKLRKGKEASERERVQEGKRKPLSRKQATWAWRLGERLRHSPAPTDAQLLTSGRVFLAVLAVCEGSVSLHSPPPHNQAAGRAAPVWRLFGLFHLLSSSVSPYCVLRLPEIDSSSDRWWSVRERAKGLVCVCVCTSTSHYYSHWRSGGRRRGQGEAQAWLVMLVRSSTFHGMTGRGRRESGLECSVRE